MDHSQDRAEVAELRMGPLRHTITGRTLRLIIWLAVHQADINATAADCGQLWVTWKGDGPGSISGDIKTRL